jgi:hypothetical protein
VTPLDLIVFFLILSCLQALLQRVLADSEAGTRTIEMTGKDVPIDLRQHTKGRLALGADKIVWSSSAVLGPDDPWVGDRPAASTGARRGAGWRRQRRTESNAGVSQ